MSDKIIGYYNSNLKKRIYDFALGNERVSRASDELLLWIELYKPKNILEIGCGIGDVSFKVAEKFPDANILGYDISDKTIEFGKSVFQLSNFKLEHGSNFDDLSLLVGNKSLDFIFLIDVFEHFDLEEVLNFIIFLKCKTTETPLIFLSCPTIKHQNFLRENNPKGLQPIDRDITINHFLDLANQLDMDLLFYKSISVWNSSDYQHAVIGKIPDFQKFSDRIKIPAKGIKTLLNERFFKKENDVSAYELIKTKIRKEIDE